VILDNFVFFFWRKHWSNVYC